MNLSAPFIKRPVMTTLVMFAMIFFGVASYKALPVSDLPSVAYPTLLVTANLPGGNPDVMANSVASPLEKAFLSVEGLKFMTSANTPGQSQIVLQFSLDTDIGSAAADVNSQISATLSQLPKQMPTNPTYQKVNPADSPILYLRVSSYTDPLGDLYEWAKTYIGERLSLVDGVAQVLVYGAPYSPRVKIDPQVLAAKGLDLSDINQSIQSGNVYTPIGTMDGAKRYYLFNADGQLMNAAGYNSLVYVTNKGAYGTLDEIGTTIDFVQNDKQFNYFINKERPPEASIVLAIKKIPGANTLKVNQTINDLLPKLRRQIPGSVDVAPIFDRSVFIEEAVKDVEFTLTLSIILVVAVIFVYLGRITDTLIPSIVLPITIVATFALMYLLDFSIDTLSLMALTLAIGFVVDDAIVVLENIVRHTEMGKEPFNAALDGSQQISVTVFTMTLALSIVFIPLIFLAGMLGRIFHEFAVTIAVAILISGVISLTLTPMLAARLVSKANRRSKLADFSEKLNSHMVGFYQPLLKKVLAWPKLTLLGGLLALVGTGLIMHSMPSTLSVNDDLGFILGATQTAETFSSLNTSEHQLNLSPIFLDDPSVQEITSVCAQTSNTGLLFIKLTDPKTRPPIQNLIKKFYPQLMAQPGINTYLRALPLLNMDAGAGSNSDYQYAFTSLDADALHDGAKKLLQELQKEPGFKNVNTDMLISTPQLNMHLLRERASLLGVSAQAIENTLQYGYSMAQVSLINAPTDQYYVILETLDSFQNDPAALNQILVKSTNQKMTYLKDLMEISQGVGSSSVNHINQLPSVTFAFSLDPTLALSDALKTIEELKNKLMAPSVSGSLIGAAQEFQSTMKSIMILTLITVVIIYILLGVLYESFLFPLTVISALPVAVLGGLITLLLFGETLTLYSMVGLIMLIGIVQKNGIMLVDFAVEFMREKNVSAEEAMYEACSVRFRPIIMTTLAAIMGAMPIALAIGGGTASSRQPLGLVVVGGLIFSQLLTLFLTPVVFIKLEHLRHIFKKKKNEAL